MHFMDKIDTVSWNELTQGMSSYFSSQWLRYDTEYFDGKSWTLIYKEDSNLKGCASLYEVAKETSSFFCPSYVLGLSPENALAFFKLSIGSTANTIEELKSEFAKNYYPSLVIRNSFRSQLIHRDESSFSIMIDEIKNFAERNKFKSIVFPYAPQSELGKLCNNNFNYYESIADYEISLSACTDFSDYLAKLSSKKRIMVKSEIKKFEQSDYSLLQAEVKHDYLEEVSQLQYSLLKKNNYHRSVSDILKNHYRICDIFSNISYYSLRYKDENVGYVSYLIIADTLYVFSIGFNYAKVDRSIFAYQYMAFYFPIKIAIQSGLQKIALGVESDKAKSARGANAQQLYFAICLVED